MPIKSRVLHGLKWQRLNLDYKQRVYARDDPRKAAQPDKMINQSSALARSRCTAYYTKSSSLHAQSYAPTLCKCLALTVCLRPAPQSHSGHQSDRKLWQGGVHSSGPRLWVSVSDSEILAFHPKEWACSAFLSGMVHAAQAGKGRAFKASDRPACAASLSNSKLGAHPNRIAEAKQQNGPRGFAKS